MAPPYLQASDVPQADKDAQARIFAGQLEEEGKVPAERRAQVIEGKVTKWVKEVSLLDQPSVIEPKKTVDQLRAEAEKAAGGTLKLLPFVRFERGEGIELPQGPDFAAEVAAMAGA